MASARAIAWSPCRAVRPPVKSKIMAARPSGLTCENLADAPDDGFGTPQGLARVPRLARHRPARPPAEGLAVFGIAIDRARDSHCPGRAGSPRIAPKPTGSGR